MADRGDRVKQMLLGRVVCLIGSGGIAVTLIVVGDAGVTSVVPLLAASLVVGIGFSVGSPAMQALVPALVRPEELASAVALDNFPMMIGRAIGPALGAAVALSVGFGAAFALAAFGHLVFLLLNWRLKVARPASEEESLGDGSIRSSLSYLRSRPAALLLILGVAAVGFGADPALTLAPSIAHEIDGGPQLAGGFASAFGVGAVLSFLCLPTLRRELGTPRLSCTGLVLLAAGSAGLSLIHDPVTSLLAFAVSGAGMTIAVTGSTTMLYELVEDEWRGRIMAFWIVGFVGSRPFAAGLNGVVAESVSVEAALLVTAAVVLAAAWLCRPANITPVSARTPESP
jgi:MFS family permease